MFTVSSTHERCPIDATVPAGRSPVVAAQSAVILTTPRQCHVTDLSQNLTGAAGIFDNPELGDGCLAGSLRGWVGGKVPPDSTFSHDQIPFFRELTPTRSLAGRPTLSRQVPGAWPARCQTRAAARRRCSREHRPSVECSPESRPYRSPWVCSSTSTVTCPGECTWRSSPAAALAFDT
jgi:hypothetical protein